MPNRRHRSQSWLPFLLISLLTYFSVQSVMVVAHEYAHSTAAWLLRKSPTPNTVIWGNPLTILGWDEGVPYDQLFPSGHHPAESVIGGIPLLIHAAFLLVSLALLQRSSLASRKPLVFILYWFVVANLGELVAYLLMRPFAGSGDTGRFNQGLGLSPWPLFLGGLAFLALAFAFLLTRTLPRVAAILAPDPARHRLLVWLSAFLIFLWTSGLRVMSLFPDRQWRWGLPGILLFLALPLADRLQTTRAPNSSTAPQ